MKPRNLRLVSVAQHEDSTPEAESLLDSLADQPLISAEDERVLTRQLKQARVAIRKFEQEELTATDATRSAIQQKRADAHQKYDEIANILWHANVRWALQLAHQFKRLAFMDRFQWAALGLWRAIQLYDPDITINGKPVRVSTYATYWIRQHMQRGADAGQALIRIPASANELARFLTREQARFVQEYGTHPTIEELCVYSGVDIERATPVMNIMTGILSLDRSYAAPNGDVGSEGQLVDLLLDESDIEEQFAERSERERVQDSVRDVIRRMEEYTVVVEDKRGVIRPLYRPAQAIKLRYRIGEPYEPGVPPTRTLEEVGKLLVPPVTRDRVNQLQRIAVTWIAENCPELRNLNGIEED